MPEEPVLSCAARISGSDLCISNRGLGLGLVWEARGPQQHPQGWQRTDAQRNDVSGDIGLEAVGSSRGPVDLEQPHAKIRVDDEVIAVELKAAGVVFAAQLRPCCGNGAHYVLAYLGKDVEVEIDTCVMVR